MSEFKTNKLFFTGMFICIGIVVISSFVFNDITYMIFSLIGMFIYGLFSGRHIAEIQNDN